MSFRIQYRVELCIVKRRFYAVKRGQTIFSVAEAFSVSPGKLAAVNALFGEVCAGQVLAIPPSGNLYTVRGGESRTLLCGSAEKFEEKNGTKHLYIGQTVML